jgi:curved DNA-binding protein
MDHKDYYKILGISRQADAAEIKRAYRTLARQFHPDLNGGTSDAEQKFKEINEAYTVLSDPEKRRIYDQVGANWQQRRSGTEPFNWSGWFGEENNEPPPARKNRPHVRTEETGTPPPRDRQESSRHENDRQESGGQSTFSDFFQQLFGTGSNESTPGRTYTTRSGPFDRNEPVLPVEITLEEAFWGTARTIQQGTERFEISIPRGVANGSKVRITPGRDALTLIIALKPHDLFRRDGDNLHSRIKLDLYTALLGGEVNIPTLEGPLLLVVPANTQNERIFRLKGKGMPLVKTPEQRGDLLVEVEVTLPVPLTDEERRRFVELRRLRQGPNDLFS